MARLNRRQFLAAGLGVAGAAATGLGLSTQVWPLILREDIIPGRAPDRELQPDAWTVSEDHIRFAVIGDSGSGGRNAMAVADRMARTYQRDPYGLVVLLGDQPGVRRDDVWRLVEQGSGHPVAVSRYAAPAAGPHQGDTRGHPFWFARSTFADLERLHGDKAIWKLLESGRHPVAEVAMEGAVPLDVDTWEDYERLLAVGEATTSWRER